MSNASHHCSHATECHAAANRNWPTACTELQKTSLFCWCHFPAVIVWPHAFSFYPSGVLNHFLSWEQCPLLGPAGLLASAACSVKFGSHYRQRGKHQGRRDVHSRGGLGGLVKTRMLDPGSFLWGPSQSLSGQIQSNFPPAHPHFRGLDKMGPSSESSLVLTLQNRSPALCGFAISETRPSQMRGNGRRPLGKVGDARPGLPLQQYPGGADLR